MNSEAAQRVVAAIGNVNLAVLVEGLSVVEQAVFFKVASEALLFGAAQLDFDADAATALLEEVALILEQKGAKPQ